MTENDLYDTLQALMPAGLQFVDPYLDEVPLPQDNYAQMNIIEVQPIGWNQRRVDKSDDKKATFAYDIEKIYRVQVDFYGSNAYDNALYFHQALSVNLVEDDDTICLKRIGNIENRCFLQENKKYLKRYGFDIELFIVDTITKDSPYLENILVNLARIGN
jgi:hypothetical protein